MITKEDFAYKGIHGTEGLKAFEMQEEKAITQLKNIVDFVVRNKDIVPAFDKDKLKAFLAVEIKKLDEISKGD